MFIKHGDGKIVSVIDAEELSDEQKKANKDIFKRIKKSDKGDPSVEEKQSGR